MKIKAKVAELTKADVRYVSLVPRGANRIPFRVIKSDKQESGMGIDLSGLVRSLKGEKKTAAAPKVTALVLTSKGEDFEVVKKAISEAGFNVEAVIENEDGSVTFQQEENPLEEADAFRMSDNLVAIVKGFSPYSSSISTSFKDQVAAQGFWSNMRTACETFSNVVSNSMYDTDSPEEAASVVQKTVKEFGEYMVALAKGLPSNAFKAEKLVTTAVEAFKAEKLKQAGEKKPTSEKPDDVSAEDWDAMSDEDKKKASKKKAEPVATEAKTETPEEKTTVVSTDDIVQKAASIVTSSLKGDLENIQTMLKNLGEAQKSLTEGHTALKSQIEEVTKKADDAEKVIKSTVVASQPNGDAVASVRTHTARKSGDGDPRTGCFDTAFLPNNGRPAVRS